MTTPQGSDWNTDLQWEDGLEWQTETPSKQEDIIVAYKALLETILKANKYNTDLGALVKEWGSPPFPSDTTIGMVFRTGQFNTDAISFGCQEHRFTVENYILIVGTASDKRKAIADFYQCIGTDLTLGGLANISFSLARSAEVEHNRKRAFWIKIEISIKYVTDNWNPYD